MQRLLTVSQVAEWLGKPPSWVRWAVRTRVLPHVRVGQQLRFDQAAISAWLAERTTDATSAPRAS